MGIPVNEMLRRMGSREVTEWVAFFQVRKEFEKEAELQAKAAANLKRQQSR